MLPTVSYHSFLPRQDHSPTLLTVPDSPHLAALSWVLDSMGAAVGVREAGWLGWEVDRRGAGAQQRARHRYEYGVNLKEGYQRSPAGAEGGLRSFVRVSEVGRREPRPVLEQGRPREGIA